jgi:hypothetical protein
VLLARPFVSVAGFDYSANGDKLSDLGFKKRCASSAYWSFFPRQISLSFLFPAFGGHFTMPPPFRFEPSLSLRWHHDVIALTVFGALGFDLCQGHPRPMEPLILTLLGTSGVELLRCHLASGIGMCTLI